MSTKFYFSSVFWRKALPLQKQFIQHIGSVCATDLQWFLERQFSLAQKIVLNEKLKMTNNLDLKIQKSKRGEILAIFGNQNFVYFYLTSQAQIFLSFLVFCSKLFFRIYR